MEIRKVSTSSSRDGSDHSYSGWHIYDTYCNGKVHVTTRQGRGVFSNEKLWVESVGACPGNCEGDVILYTLVDEIMAVFTNEAEVI